MNEFTDEVVEDLHEDYSLAPRSWDSYIGQEKTKERLQLAIQGSLDRYEPMKHTLLLGPPGTGKTSLAELIAQELKQDLLALTMTPNFKMKALYNKIKKFEGGVIFLDEIHCLSDKHQHYLLDVLEKRKMTYDDGKVEYINVPITFVAATTEPDDLIVPLYERFTLRFTLGDYSEIEMARIVERMALMLNLEVTRDACLALGKASAGIPRQARRLVFAAQDLGSIEHIDDILDTCGITKEGLTEDHLAYLKAIDQLSHNGKAVGIKNICNMSGRPREIVERLEKLLIDKDMVELTSSGRLLLYKGERVLKENLYG